MQKKTNGFTFESDTEYRLSIQRSESENDILKLKIALDFEGEICPKPVTIRWTYPCGEIFSQWNPQLWSARYLNPNWMPIRNRSRSAEGAPIQLHMTADGINEIAVYLSDVQNAAEIASGVIEETAELSYKLVLLAERTAPMQKYETELVIDRRKIPYEQMLKSVSEYWNSDCGAGAALWEPVYSTWYAYHQNLDSKTLLEELAAAKEFGMTAVIIDDGWQTEDSERGYAHCGDWQPKKLGNMSRFVKDVHMLGMKCILWYSVPFIGRYTNVWERFKDRTLNKLDPKHPWCILDPRYPEVREYLLSLYESAVREWDIDGLKLDFINNMQLTEDSHEPNEEMDYTSLEDAICALLAEVQKRLTAVKADIVFEFRQPYTGPAMSRCGGIQRAADCPLDAMKNRVETTDLRLLAGEKTAVHSDMLMWDYNASAETAALQLINVMFSVPQISVRLAELSKPHRSMLKFYLGLWKRYRECFISGKLRAYNPEIGYSLISGEAGNKTAAAAYVKNCMEIKKSYSEIVFINGSWDDRLYIENYGCGIEIKCKIYDCTGNLTEETHVLLKNGTNSFAVPKSGALLLSKAAESETA